MKKSPIPESERIKNYNANPNPEMDITDTIMELKNHNTEAQFKQMNIIPGRVMGFDYEGSKTYIEIGRVENGQYFAKEVEMHAPNTVLSHSHHAVDQSKNPPYCWDCEVPVTEMATVEGKQRYETRKELHFSDGTPIDDIEEDDEPELPALV